MLLSSQWVEEAGGVRTVHWVTGLVPVAGTGHVRQVSGFPRFVCASGLLRWISPSFSRPFGDDFGTAGSTVRGYPLTCALAC